MTKTNVHKHLITFLRPLGRRLRFRLSIEWLMRTAWMALGACIVALLAGRIFPLEAFRTYALGLLAAWLVVWVVYSVIRPFKPFDVARRADVELGLRDRLSTALAFSDPRRRVPSGFDRVLVSLQLDDALATARSIEPRQAFPVRFERALVLRAAVALLVAALLFVLPNPMDAIVAQRAQIAQTAKTEAARLEKLEKEVEQNASLSKEEREELLRQLRQMIEQLKSNPGDAKKALADLAKFQEQLRAKLDPAAPTEAAAMEALAQQLAQLAGAKEKPQDAAEAAKLLEQLAAEMDKLTPEQREALANALERAAAQTAGSNSELARSLSEMAQATREGASAQATQRAAAQAAQAMRQATSDEAWQQALARALNQADASQRAVAQAAAAGQQGQRQGQGQGQQQGQGQGQRPGQGQQQGQGQQPGQGQGQQPGQGQGQGQQQGMGQGQGQGNQVGGGGGTNADTLPPAVRTGQASAPTGPNKPFGTGSLDTVYAPIAAGQGQQQSVDGQQGQDGQTTSIEGRSPQPGASNPALVPYSQVYQQYSQIASQAMERAYIPAGLQDYVKEYFSRLEP
jgi:hypothetical protein